MLSEYLGLCPKVNYDWANHYRLFCPKGKSEEEISKHFILDNELRIQTEKFKLSLKDIFIVKDNIKWMDLL